MIGGRTYSTGSSFSIFVLSARATTSPATAVISIISDTFRPICITLGDIDKLIQMLVERFENDVHQSLTIVAMQDRVILLDLVTNSVTIVCQRTEPMYHMKRCGEFEIFKMHHESAFFADEFVNKRTRVEFLFVGQNDLVCLGVLLPPSRPVVRHVGVDVLSSVSLSYSVFVNMNYFVLTNNSWCWYKCLNDDIDKTQEE